MSGISDARTPVATPPRLFQDPESSRRSPSIRTQLFTIVAAIVVPLAGVLIYSIYADARHAITDARSAARTLAVVTASDTARTLKANREALQVLAQRPLVRLVDAMRCDPVLREVRPLFPAAIDVAVFDRNGDLVCSAVRPRGETFSVAKTPWFSRDLKADRLIVGPPTWGVQSGRWLSVLAQPIHDAGNEVLGLLVLPLDLTIYIPNLSTAPLPPDTAVGIVTENGAHVWSNAPIGTWIGKTVDPQSPLKALLKAKGGETEGAGPGSENLLYAMEPIAGAEWYAYIGIPSRVIYAEVYASAVPKSLIGLLSLLAITGFVLMLSRRVQRPVQSLVAAIRAIREGREETRAQAGEVREIAELAGEFNLMLDHLRASERRLRDIFESVNVLTVMVDVSGRLTFCNQKLLDLTGWRRDEAIGKNWFRTFRPPEQGEEYFARYLDGIATGDIALHYEGDLVSRDGKRFVIFWSHTLMRDPEGRITGVASIGQDVTQRKRAEAEIERLNRTLEQRVAERTAELDRANRELESFAYSVSHDLRGPARTMVGFSTILLEKSRDRLDPESIDYVNRIDAGARRMGRLIDDLLRLSRISRSEMHRREFDLSRLVHAVAGSLVDAHPERQVELSIDPGMRAEGDPGLIRILLENVLGNAWKFTSCVERTRIQAGCEQRDGTAVYFVRDNGAGFDMRFADKLFSPFQRLHREDEFEGTGIGLSIVARIVAMHGGVVWAEGTPGRGATVYFTLAAGGRLIHSGKTSFSSGPVAS